MEPITNPIFSRNIPLYKGKQETKKPALASERRNEREQEKEQIAMKAKASLDGVRVSDAAREEDGKAASSTVEEMLSLFSFEDAVAQCGRLVDGMDQADSLEKLRESGLPEAVDLDALDGKLARISKLDPQGSAKDTRRIMEYISSQYSVYKDRLKQQGGEEAEEQLLRLDEIVEKHVDRFARSFSESVGGFFEDNGMQGERERMYNSVRKGIYEMSRCYDDFIRQNSSYAEVPSGDEWLKNCGDYMASELRKSYVAAGGGTPLPGECYSTGQLSRAASMALMGETFVNSEHGDAVSEEELGMRLGAMALKGMAYLSSFEDGLPQHREIYLRAFGNRMEAILDESDRKIADQQKAAPKEKRYPPLDREAVAAVVGTIVDYYVATGNGKDALQAGADFGYSAFRQKQGNGIARYRESPYWESMFRSISTGYWKKSEFQRMVDEISVLSPVENSLESLFGDTVFRSRRA